MTDSITVSLDSSALNVALQSILAILEFAKGASSFVLWSVTPTPPTQAGALAWALAKRIAKHERPLYYPEDGRELSEVRWFLQENIKEHKPLVIVTRSLFVMREIYMADQPTCWIATSTDPTTHEVSAKASMDIAGSGRIPALEEELDQADRYMEFEFSKGRP